MFPDRGGRVPRSTSECNLGGDSSVRWHWPATLAASNVLGANERIRVGIIGPGDRGKEILREAVGCDNVECVGIADVYAKRRDEGRSVAPNARTYSDYRALLDDQVDRRGAHRHAAAPARRALHGGARRRQARLPGKDHGVHGGRMPSACARPTSAPAGARCRSGISGRPTGQISDAISFLKPELIGQDHCHPRPHVPQHAARKAAVGAARVPGHDGREHRLEGVSGRGAAAAVRREPLRQLALLLGLLRRQRLREHVPPGRFLVQDAGAEDSALGHHDRRRLSVEGRPRECRTP